MVKRRLLHLIILFKVDTAGLNNRFNDSAYSGRSREFKFTGHIYNDEQSTLLIHHTDSDTLTLIINNQIHHLTNQSRGYNLPSLPPYCISILSGAYNYIVFLAGEVVPSFMLQKFEPNSRYEIKYWGMFEE